MSIGQRPGYEQSRDETQRVEPEHRLERAGAQAEDCALASALEVLGERWTLLIIRDAFYGVCRFSDFQAHLDIPMAVLASRLSGLVTDGILHRLPDPQHAGRSRYMLTAAGREL